MKKEEYREARREFGETAAGLGKEVRKEAREAYRNVRESADTRMKEIKEELRETERMEKILGDGCSSHNIREARETARRAKDMVNMEVITARADFDDDKADFREEVAEARRRIRDDAKAGTVAAKTYDISDQALRAKDDIDADMADSLDRLSRLGRQIGKGCGTRGAPFGEKNPLFPAAETKKRRRASQLACATILKSYLKLKRPTALNGRVYLKNHFRHTMEKPPSTMICCPVT